MELTRREFLYNAGIGALALAIRPSDAIAVTAPKNHKVSLDAYIDDIKDDRFSQSFYQNQSNNLFSQAVEKVARFYSGIGKPYGLPGVDLITQLKRGELPSEIKDLERNTIELYYTSRDKLGRFYRKDVNRFLFDIWGTKYEDRVKEYVEDFIRQYLKSNPTIKHQKKTIKHRMKSSIFENQWEMAVKMNMGGMGSMHSHRAYVFPLPTYFYEVLNDYELELVNLFGYLIAHEIGHVLSLDHPKPLGSLGAKNLMGVDTNSNEIINAVKMDIKLAEAQVRQINEYLKER